MGVGYAFAIDGLLTSTLSGGDTFLQRGRGNGDCSADAAVAVRATGASGSATAGDDQWGRSLSACWMSQASGASIKTPMAHKDTVVVTVSNQPAASSVLQLASPRRGSGQSKCRQGAARRTRSGAAEFSPGERRPSDRMVTAASGEHLLKKPDERRDANDAAPRQVGGFDRVRIRPASVPRGRGEALHGDDHGTHVVAFARPIPAKGRRLNATSTASTPPSYGTMALVERRRHSGRTPSSCLEPRCAVLLVPLVRTSMVEREAS